MCDLNGPAACMEIRIALKEGKNQYLFRVSSDYYWYCEEINGFSLKADGEAYDVSMKILDGD